MDIISEFRKEATLISNNGENKAFTVWAMGLYLNESDLIQLAVDSLTDNGDDKKIDFLRIDAENNILYVVQGYYSSTYKEQAPANKASDLNCASAWLTTGDITKFDSHLQDLVKEARGMIEMGVINTIELVYVHNCGESKQTDDELKTASQMLTKALAEKNVDVQYRELGLKSLMRLYANQAANIIVTGVIDCPFKIQYTEETDGWKAAVLTTTGTWLRNLYNVYKNDLFSANYRGYLGQGRRKINVGIKRSAETDASNFWAYNNGITILTTRFESKPSTTTLYGISIINGAQTTGTIANITSAVNLDNVKIVTRIIACEKPELIGTIVKYNNTQNRITAWDGYSNDPKQIELQKQFDELGHVYIFKRGFDSRDYWLSVENCIQPLIAFIGKYKDANRSKTAVFESRSLYTDAFETTKVRHILLVMYLNRCIQQIKVENRKKVAQGSGVSTSDKDLYEMFAPIKSKYWVMAFFGDLLPKLYTDLSDKSEISLMPKHAKLLDYSVDAIVELMKPVINIILTQLVSVLKEKGGIMTCYDNSSLISEISSIVESKIAALRTIPEIDQSFGTFKNMICAG